jgi:hypothetical protein
MERKTIVTVMDITYLYLPWVMWQQIKQSLLSYMSRKLMKGIPLPLSWTWNAIYYIGKSDNILNNPCHINQGSQGKEYTVTDICTNKRPV